MTTEVIYQLDKESNFRCISIKNHANYLEKGQDIVCAGISAITNGTVNFLSANYKDFCQISYRPAEIIISLTIINLNCQLCLRLMLYQLKNIASSHPTYLEIKKEKLN